MPSLILKGGREADRLLLMHTFEHIVIACAITLPASGVMAQANHVQPDTIHHEQRLDDVVVRGQGGGYRSRVRVDNVELIGADQLVRAACCNLGESFVANPSVDVNYSDAATGARQIKLLGLSGTYVQMMVENMLALRGAAIPYALNFVPGPWMQSIQVSKGASSVKNGYESITGQINIEYLKPQGTDGVRANAYLDSQLKYELNLDASHHFTDRLSASILTHFEDRQQEHDGNGDGFVDMPRQRQWNVMPRVAYVSPRWISQLSVRALGDKRESGQLCSFVPAYPDDMPYLVNVSTDRYEAQWKNGFPFGDDHNTSLALMVNGSWHDARNGFGLTHYDILQKNGYAQLMFETDLTERHNLSIGLSVNHDYYKTHRYRYAPDAGLNDPYYIDIPGLDPSMVYNMHMREKETTSGAYAQYTYKVGETFTLMAGLRADYSDLYQRRFVTPRLHLKYSPSDIFTLRASAGKGYRTPQLLAENVPMLLSGRTLYVENSESFFFPQEEAWNYGLSTSLSLPIADRTLALNAEYYYTDFVQQLVIEYPEVYYHQGEADAWAIVMHPLTGQSYSHTLQVDATYPFFDGFEAMAAFRYNDARTTYRDGNLRRRPLTSSYKGLVTLTYKTPLEFWQFDVTGQLNGGGELYDRTAYPAYFQLQAQVTREFRHFSLYVGGENLTGYKMDHPIQHAAQPWSPSFDATQVWGPTEGAMFYVGLRLKFESF